MVKRDKVWVVPRGYSPLTGCKIRGNVVLITQYGGGARKPAAVAAVVLPSNMLLTEASDSLLQETGSYLLLDGYS